MMWNQNDTKYIIKRLILYALISCIVFFGASKCAKANVYTNHWKTNNNFTQCTGGTNACNIYSNSNGLFNNQGHGYLTFNVLEWGEPSWFPIEQITITTYNSNSVGTDYVCEIGSQNTYYDNGKQQAMITVKCRVYLESGGLNYVTVFRPTSAVGTMYVAVGPYVQFETLDSEANAIINANNSAIQSQINAGNANAQAIQNAINTSTQQEIAAIQAATQATNDNTAAINAQTQWQQQNFQFDTSWSDSLNLFGNDTNYIRQLLMWPFTFSLVIGQSLGGSSCNAYTFGSLYGTQITLPCINWKNYVGNTIYTAIDTIMGMVILFGVITYIRKVFEYVFSFGAKAYETVDVEVFK